MTRANCPTLPKRTTCACLTPSRGILQERFFSLPLLGDLIKRTRLNAKVGRSAGCQKNRNEQQYPPDGHKQNSKSRIARINKNASKKKARRHQQDRAPKTDRRRCS